MKRRIRRFKTIVALPGVFNTGVEYIEYYSNKGTFYRKGSLGKQELNLDIYTHIFKQREVDKWYEALSSVELSETEEFSTVYPTIKEEIKNIDEQIKELSNQLNMLYFKRTDLMKTVND